MKPWYCGDCQSVMNLDVHGRCEVCASDAVDIALRPAMTVEGIAGGLTRDDLEELRVWSLLELRGQ